MTTSSLWPYVDIDADANVADPAWSGRQQGTDTYIYPTDMVNNNTSFPFPDDFADEPFAGSAHRSSTSDTNRNGGGGGNDDATEDDLIYYPKADDIPFPDDMGGPFCRRKKQEDPPGETQHIIPPRMDNNTRTTNNKQTWRAVMDKSTGKVYYYNRKTRETTWNKPDGSDIVNRPPRQFVQGDDDCNAFEAHQGSGSSSLIAPQAQKKTRMKSSSVQLIKENKDDDSKEADIAISSAAAQDQPSGKPNDKNSAVAIVGAPVIVLNHNDDVSEASSLSASNAGWYRQQQQSAAKTQKLSAAKASPSPTGVIFVQGSCSERVNGIYQFSGMVDFVGIYTKVETYGDTKISFRIYRRQLASSPDMSRKWFLSIGPGSGGTRTEYDIDLFSAPASVCGPAVCFIDELPPRNKWVPVDGSGLEGTKGPLCLWIPKSADITPRSSNQATIIPAANLRTNTKNVIIDKNKDKDVDMKQEEALPSHIVVRRNGTAAASKTAPDVVVSVTESSTPPAPPSKIATMLASDTDHPVKGKTSNEQTKPDQNIFRSRNGDTDENRCETDEDKPEKEETLTTSSRNIESSSMIARDLKQKLLSETERPPPIVEPCKSTGTMATVASSTFDTTEAADDLEILDKAMDVQERNDSSDSICTTNTSTSSSDSDEKKLYDDMNGVIESLEFQEKEDDSSEDGKEGTNSDIDVWSDLSDDGMEFHEYQVLREWSDSINDERADLIRKWTKKQRVKPSTKSAEEGTCNGSKDIEAIKVDDEDYQWYARTHADKQTVIIGHIGGALQRFHNTLQQVDARINTNATDTTKECNEPGPCKCSACKEKVIKAYLEAQEGELYEL